MNSRASSPVLDAGLGIFFQSLFLGQIRIFYNRDPVPDSHKIPQFFKGPGFSDGSTGHIGFLQVMQSNEEWINGTDQGIIHLKVREVFDPPTCHIRNGTGIDQGFERTSVSVGRKSEAVFAGQQKVAFKIGCRHHTLSKEFEVILTKTIKFPFFEMGDGGFKVQGTAAVTGKIDVRNAA